MQVKNSADVKVLLIKIKKKIINKEKSLKRDFSVSYVCHNLQ